MNAFVASDCRNLLSRRKLRSMIVPEIDEESLKKLPYWKQWLYRTARELSAKEGEHGR
jgi:hypothetical protein